MTAERLIPKGLFQLISGTSRQPQVMEAYHLLDDQAASYADSIIEAPTPKYENAELAIIDILSHADPIDHGALLEASAYLSEHTNLRRYMHYQLLDALRRTEHYAPALKHLYSADPAVQEQVLDIAEGINILDDADSGTTYRKYIGDDNLGVMRVVDRSVVDAMIKHAKYAPIIAEAFIERGTLDALDDVLTAPQAISEGAL